MAERRLTSKVLTWRSSIAESGLPRTTRAVAWALANYMNDRGESAFPGVPRLCEDIGNQRGDGPSSKTTVIDALRELQEAGYLERVRVGGGRRLKAEWQARFPETVQQLNPLDAAEGTGSRSAAAVVSGAPGASGEVVSGASEAGERVQSQHPLAAAERVQSQDEKGAVSVEKGAVAEPEVEVLEVDQEVAAATRAREAAAAAEVERRLARLNVVGELRAQALADPARALAWLELGEREARRNPAGLFRIGFESTAWPSPRLEPAAVKAQGRLAKKRASLDAFVEMPEEARYLIDVEWETLTPDERSELHEYFDQLIRGDVAERPRRLRAVDAA